jgi:Domain of unknown function (DUF4375)
MSDSASNHGDYIGLLYEKVDIYNGAEKYLASISVEPYAAVIVYAAHFCQSEIHNGGLLQFFWNNTGVLAPEALEGFRVIGMPRLAAVLKGAMAKLGEPYPRDRDDRWDALLIASGFDEDALKVIFEGTESLYLKFVNATEGLDFRSSDEQIWDLTVNENGGFVRAANQYLASQPLM